MDVLKPCGTYRSRLVATEINVKAIPDLFAATPPLETFKLLLRLHAKNKNHVLLHLDVSRAYLYAHALRDVYIRLPTEDTTEGEEHLCGKLDKAMYGTRDAAQAWQREYTSALKELGFQVGKASPCHFHHPQWGVSLAVHGDDFLATGPEHRIKQLMARMAAKYKIKTTLLGEKHGRELRLLSRTIRWSEQGIEYEGDDRHAKKIVADLDIKPGQTLVSPMTKVDPNGPGDTPLIRPEDVTKYRALAARCNFMGQDRPDVQFAAKESSRRMSNPQWSDMERLMRIGKYLNNNCVAYQLFKWGDHDGTIHAYSDADWAGCHRTRKSTSGGLLSLGRSTVKHWSSPQKAIALSTSESELYAATRTLQEAMGLRSVARDFGVELDIILHIDASATFSLAHRQGLGKNRHIEVQELWLQDALDRHEYKLKKIPGNSNPADLMTKPATREMIDKYMDMMGFKWKATA